MYPLAASVRALYEAEQRQVLRITYNGGTITDADVMEGGFEIDRYSCNGNKLEYGTAIAAEMTLKLDNRQGKFDGVIFEGVEMFVEIGIADWTQTNPTINWMPCGYFTADRQPRTLNTITINALDRMTRFDTTKPMPIPWTDGDGNVMTDGRGNTIEFAAELSFPTTIANLIAQICLRCGIEMGEPVSWRTNSSYVVEALPDLQQEITYRNLIQWCAGIMGTNAWMDWDGKIRFSRYNNGTPYVMTTANRFSSDLYENDITVTGVSYTNTKNETTLHGTSEYALDFTGNYLIPENSASVLGNLYTNLRNFTYRPFSATVKNAPYMWPMDTVVFTDKNGVNHNCVLTNVNFGLNGTTVLEGRGETTEINSTTAPSAMTTQQGFVIEKAVEKTLDNVDKSMTQEAIFNRLTNNGTTQALILYEGNLYLNATYINTGTLVADIIKGGTLKLGGSANENGILQILDDNGAVVGEWDKDGINLIRGYISDKSGSNYWNLDSGEINTQKGYIGGFTLEEGNLIYSNEQAENVIGISSIKFLRWPNSDTNRKGIMLSGQGLIFFDRTRYESSQTPAAGIIAGYDTTNNLTSLSLGAVGSINGTLYPQLIISKGTTHRLVSVDDSSLFIAAGGASVTGDLTVTGTKSREVATEQYSNRLLYCYETPSPLFGDVGEGVIAEDGKCYVWLDPVFAQTITTDQYQVFLQRYGRGDCWVSERKAGYFVVEGESGLAFGWEIKAKQRDFDQMRLDNAEKPFSVPVQTYGEDAAQHIHDIMKERDIQ